MEIEFDFRKEQSRIFGTILRPVAKVIFSNNGKELAEVLPRKPWFIHQFIQMLFHLSDLMLCNGKSQMHLGFCEGDPEFSKGENLKFFRKNGRHLFACVSRRKRAHIVTRWLHFLLFNQSLQLREKIADDLLFIFFRRPVWIFQRFTNSFQKAKNM